ncbi:hypothetical protein H5410_041630 [Solanum commersonii]|uniref:Uncharacterized protein n=1 Tax=Solanum commersonii TaxID=4109 RepID=A0A9J5XV44_SOLCO|nr:hypothetical protein H5410_041630 [Solanum commersonii]
MDTWRQGTIKRIKERTPILHPLSNWSHTGGGTNGTQLAARQLQFSEAVLQASRRWRRKKIMRAIGA